MLLDTGALHADPHPGNLLRTRTGALCVLDFGLVAPVTQPQQYAILSYIAHLVAKDYAAVPGDLQAMGFVPESKAAALRDSGVVDVLADVFRALSRGGGAKAVSAGLRDINAQRKAAEEAAAAAAGAPGSGAAAAAAGVPSSRADGRKKGGGRVDALAKDIRYIQETYGNILQIPSYFAYILRAFRRAPIRETRCRYAAARTNAHQTPKPHRTVCLRGLAFQRILNFPSPPPATPTWRAAC